MVSSEMGHASHMSRTPTPRQRAREEMKQRILATARGHMAEVGPAQLSLRAVARDLGVASSAVYRYVESRDDLITRLILEIYGELADAAEAACADAGADLSTQWSGWAHTMRDWARAHPYDWPLVYGTPIPGYAAPADTVEPAVRVLAPVLRVMGHVPGELDSPATAASLAPLGDFARDMGATAEVGSASGLEGIAAWAAIQGFINLELGGHLVGGVLEADPVFDALVEQTAPARPHACDVSHSLTRASDSASLRSSTRVMIDQRTPNGSRMLAKRSPDTNVATGSRTVAPALTARATTASTSAQ